MELEILVLGLLQLHSAHALAFGQDGDAGAVLGSRYCLRMLRWIEGTAADSGLQRGRVVPVLSAQAQVFG